MKKNRRTALVMTVILLVSMTLFTACGANSGKSALSRSDSADVDYNAYYEGEVAAAPMMTTAPGTARYSAVKTSEPAEPEASYERKIVKTVDMQLQTKEFDNATAYIQSSAAAVGGYVENSYIGGKNLYSQDAARNASFTLRIPSEQLDGYVNSISSKYNVLYKNENSSDISDSYYDIDARLKSLLTQEERLLKMLEGATDLQYMIEVERELSDVRYRIENYYSQIKRYDSQVSMSTVTMNLTEVVEYEKVPVLPVTFWQRIVNTAEDTWDSFVDGLQDFLLFLIEALPAIVIIVLILVIIIIIVKTHRRHKKKEEKQ